MLYISSKIKTLLPQAQSNAILFILSSLKAKTQIIEVDKFRIFYFLLFSKEQP